MLCLLYIEVYHPIRALPMKSNTGGVSSAITEIAFESNADVPAMPLSFSRTRFLRNRERNSGNVYAR
jgi:hypothetical protein